MDANKSPVKGFKDHAQSVLEEQTAKIKLKYKDKESVKKSFRLKIFNEHLNILKEQLHAQMNNILLQAGDKSPADKAELEKTLKLHFNEYVHEFLRKDFDPVR